MLPKATPIVGAAQECGKHFDLQSSGNCYCLTDGRLVSAFPNSFWATLVIVDQGFHEKDSTGMGEL